MFSMKKTGIFLISIIILLFSLSMVQFQECGFGFGNSKINAPQYCPIATINFVPIIVINIFTDFMVGIVISFVLGLAVISLSLYYRADIVLILSNNIIRRLNDAQNAICLWMRQFGTGFVSSSYL